MEIIIHCLADTWFQFKFENLTFCTNYAYKFQFHQRSFGSPYKWFRVMNAPDGVSLFVRNADLSSLRCF